MSRVGVRSAALSAASRALDDTAGLLRGTGAELLAAAARCRPPPPAAAGSLRLLAQWWRLEVAVARAVGPGGVAGEALALESVAARLALAARAYERVEAGVAALMTAVAGAADASGSLGWFDEGGAVAEVRVVESGWGRTRVGGLADLVAAGDGLEGGRVRVLEVAAAGGGSAWVVVVPGTQGWSPVPGANPFDLSTDVRAVTGDDATVAAAGVALALQHARAASARSTSLDPVMLVGHSQGGILAAALAGDTAFGRRHRVTHLLTTGAPVGSFPVPASVRVLAVEHGDDPVPGLDLTPNPASAHWLTLRAGGGPPLDVGRHRLARYVETVRAVTGAPAVPAHGAAVPGVAAWCAGAATFLDRPLRSVTDVVVTRRVAPAAAPRLT